MCHPKISVIIPVFNVEFYLEETLDSIVNQTFFNNLEVILVDDGSTDNSRYIMECYAEKYENIQTFYKNHEGVCSVRNFGLNVAKGEYIHLMDSDDFLLPHAYEKLYGIAKKGDYDIVTSNYIRFNETESWFIDNPRFVFNQNEGDIADTNLYDYPLLSWDMPLWNKIIKRELIVNNDICFVNDNDIIYSDNPFTIQVYNNSSKVYVLKEVLYCWRAREVGTSITQNYDLDKGKNSLKWLKLLIIISWKIFLINLF